MKIGLLSTIETNIGDDFIRCGIIEIIEAVWQGDQIEFMVINKHHPESIDTKWQIRLKRFTRRRPRLRNFVLRNCHWFQWSKFDSCDLLIQCGTPVLWTGCRFSEWAEPIWRGVLHRLSRQGIPVLNIGGGATYAWERMPQSLIGDADEEFVRLMLKTCSLTTARDELAKKLFCSLGHETEVICCPAILAGQVYVEPSEPSRKVIVNYMEGGGHFDWDQGINKMKWQETMCEVVQVLISDGWQVVLLAHDAKEYTMARQIWPYLDCERPETLQSYFEFVRDASFGIFNRMHASIAAAGLGIPSIAVGTDARNLMVAETGLPIFYVKDVTTHCLLSATKRLVEKRKVEAARLLALREKTKKRYEQLLAPFVARLKQT